MALGQWYDSQRPSPQPRTSLRPLAALSFHSELMQQVSLRSTSFSNSRGRL